MASDFNGDSLSDIFWYNSTTGDTFAWQMNGPNITNSGFLMTVPDLNWQVAGIGDLNGNGKADVLWRNVATGENYAWFMNGLAIDSSASLPQVPDLNWQVAGMADLDGDGKADIVWRNHSTGENFLWQMNGSAIAASGFLPSVVDTNWQIAGIGDMSGNGKADILWRNYVTGENYYWQMDGQTMLANGYLPTITDPNWQVMRLADIDGNGAADVIWRNQVTGGTFAWLFNTSTPGAGLVLGASGNLPTVPDLNWQIVGAGNFNADGKTDLLWRNLSTGEDYIWFMNGLSAPFGDYLPRVQDLNWEVKPAGFVPPLMVTNASVSVGQLASVTDLLINPQGTASVSCADTSVASATVSGKTVTVYGVNVGSTTCLVSASNGSATINVTVTSNLAGMVNAAVGIPANDVTNALTNPSAAFTVVQNGGPAAVTVTAGKPDVRFVVMHNGQPVSGLTIANINAVMMAQFAPSSSDLTGGPGRWVPLTTRAVQNVATDANYGNAAAAGTWYWQGNPDPKIGTSLTAPNGVSANCTAAGAAGVTVAAQQLQEDPVIHGLYTYHFCTDVSTTRDPVGDLNTQDQSAKAAVWSAGAVHRVAVHVNYTDASGTVVNAQPWFDFTVDGNGNSVPAANPQKIVDTSSCNECHSTPGTPYKMIAHNFGGAPRNDVQFCVMCHNQSSSDQHSGNLNISMANMIHKFHAGTALNNRYQVHGSIALFKTSAGYPNANGVVGATGTYGIVYPQKLLNCVKCHDNTKAAQADNWMNQPSKNACLSCHDDYASAANSAHRTNAGVTLNTSNKKNWKDYHATLTGQMTDPANALNNLDSECVACHSDAAVDTVFKPTSIAHVVPEWKRAGVLPISTGGYKYVVDGVSFTGSDATNDRRAVVEFHIANPVSGVDYDLQDNSYGSGNVFDTNNVSSASATALITTRNYKFSGVRMLIGWDAATDYLNVGAKGMDTYISSCAVAGTPVGNPSNTLSDAAAQATKPSCSDATAYRSGVVDTGPLVATRQNPITMVTQSGYDSGTSVLDVTPGAPVNTPTGLTFRAQPVSISVLMEPSLTACTAAQVSNHTCKAANAGNSKHFTVASSILPKASTFTSSNVTMAVAMIGAVIEPGPVTTPDPLPISTYSVMVDLDAADPTVPSQKAAIKYYALKGTASARRDVVNTSQCNSCHGMFINAHAHGGGRANTQVCVICHNGGNYRNPSDGASNPLNVVSGASTGTMYDAVASGSVLAWNKAQGGAADVIFGYGLPLNAAGEVNGPSVHFKHGVHLWHDELNAQPVTGLNRIKFPGDLTDCRTCHVNSSYLTDKGVLGSSMGGRLLATQSTTNGTVAYNTGANAAGQTTGNVSAVDINPLAQRVVSPKAATCSGCHDSLGAQNHMMYLGGAAFMTTASGLAITQGDLYQGAASGKVFEACDGCHTLAGAIMPVSTVHTGLLK